MQRDWPPITDPAVREWLALDHDGWLAALQERVRGFGQRTYDDAALEHALGYPWARPAGSYLLDDGAVTLLEDLPPDERRATVTEFGRDRHPLVAFGANGAPSRLEQRFEEFEDGNDRTALVLTGELHEVDVAAQASPTAYGYAPGALIASPGTAVRASLMWLTPTQFTHITHWELGYRLGRLDRARFTMDEAGVEVDSLFAFVSRIGALRLDGEPIALAAVPAQRRRVRAMTQRELLEVFAKLALGDSARGEDVARACIEDMPAFMQRIAPLTWPTAVRLPDDDWTPYPA